MSAIWRVADSNRTSPEVRKVPTGDMKGKTSPSWVGHGSSTIVERVTSGNCVAMVQEHPSRIGRRLSAILAADVAGYSRLMHDDEEATHSRLTALLSDVAEPAVAEYGGRTVKNTGDGFLAEFPSAVEAVRAALQFQSLIKELTIGDAADKRIAFRV